MKERKNYFKTVACFMVIILLHSCSMSYPKNLESDEVKSSVYAIVDEFLYENRDKSLVDNCIEDNLAWLIGEYKCDVPKEERISATEVVDWDLSENSGDGYNMFFVYYRVIIHDKSYYALVELTEFKDGRCEWVVDAIEPTLSEIKSYIEYI